MKYYAIHPLASIFPAMLPSEFATFKEDIKQNALHQPIVIFNDQVLDGRNRYNALKELKNEGHEVNPHYIQYTGDDPAGFVISLNINRRFLSEDQKIAVAQDILIYERQQAKLRQRASGGIRPLKGPDDVPGTARKPQAPSALKIAAERSGLNTSQLAAGERIQKASNEVFQFLKTGALKLPECNQLIDLKETNDGLFFDAMNMLKTSPELSIRDICRRVKHQEISKQNAELPNKLYRILMADVPWAYSKVGCTTADNYKTPDDYYPTMQLADIAAMKVKDIVADDAILFFWCPSCFLMLANDIIESWGFKYKTTWTWWKKTSSGKGAHVMGHFNSVQHEFLLIAEKGDCEPDAEYMLVATRGSCTPDHRKLFPSVFEAERRAHSQKPDIVYSMIETLYTHGEKIELFSRSKREGWDSWGNQTE